MRRDLFRGLQIGIVLSLTVGAIAIQLRADAQVELPTPTTLLATTLPSVSLTTTSLVNTTLTTTETISSVISTVSDTTTTTVAALDGSAEEEVAEETGITGVISSLDGHCMIGLFLLPECGSESTSSIREPMSSILSPVAPPDSEAREEVNEDPKTEEEEEAGSSSELADEPGEREDEDQEEPSPSLLDRLINFIDELLEEFDTEVAGVQVLSATGLAVGMLLSVAVGLLLSGLGILELPERLRRDD